MNEITEQTIQLLKDKGFSYEEYNCGTTFNFAICNGYQLSVRETKRINHSGLANVTCKVTLEQRCGTYSWRVLKELKITKLTKGQIAKIEELVKEGKGE